MTKIGWARVSTEDQHLDLQLIALKKAGCKEIFHEKISGKSKIIPELSEATSVLKRGDTLVVWQFDRLGRNARQLINFQYELKRRGISLISVTQNFDTSTPRGEIKFLEECVKAQEESVRISERTTAGMHAAKLKGVKLGRPPRFKGKQKERVRFLSKEMEMSTHQIARRFHCAPSTVWRELRA